MGLNNILEKNGQAILARACDGVARAHLQGYERAGEDEVKERLDALLSKVRESVGKRSLMPIVAHSEAVARSRYQSGFALGELQTAYNVLEEILWSLILEHLPLEEQGQALALTGSVLGAGKDALARVYVSLATHHKAPSVDLESLFSG